MKRSFESEASSHPCNIQKRMFTYNEGMLLNVCVRIGFGLGLNDNFTEICCNDNDGHNTN